MKKISLAIALVLSLSVTCLKAQKKAVEDDNKFISVMTLQASHQTHYKLTNNNTVSMDFAIYTQMKDGSWNATRHYDLQPGQMYEDVESANNLTGKYVVYSAPHSDWASFPSSIDIENQQNGGGNAAAVATQPASAPVQPVTPEPATNQNPAPSTNTNPNPATTPSTAPVRPNTTVNPIPPTR